MDTAPQTLEIKEDAPAVFHAPPCSACRHCGGQGWYVLPSGPQGEVPEQTQCEYCGGTGEMTEEEINIYDDENNYANREDSDQASRSGLHWTHS